MISRWEKRVDSHGRWYYVDHNTMTTSWQRPTIDSLQNYNRFLSSRNNERTNVREQFQQRFMFNENNRSIE